MKNHTATVRLMSVALLGGALVLGAEQARTGVAADLPPISGSDCQTGSISHENSNAGIINNCPNAVVIRSYAYFELRPGCELVLDSCPVGTMLEANGGRCDSLNSVTFPGLDQRT